MAKLERASFGSKLGVILATAGSAVGLGNVWRFPYMAGQNGGAVFIIIYVICVLLLGIPCMISEFIIGRHAQANTARAYRKIGGRNPLSFIGYMSVLTGSTPLNKEAWPVPMRLVSRCLERIAETGGPRCCKRTGRLCIREAAAFTAERFGVEMPLGEIACTYMKENRECIGRQCPFFPARGKEADA